MIKNVLSEIKDAMSALGLEYGFELYSGNSNGDIIYPYFVGGYTEPESMTEDGYSECTVMLTGFSRGSALELETARAAIEEYFNRTSGRICIQADGSVIIIFYGNAFNIPQNEADLHSIQINLIVKEWSVNA